MFGMVTTIAALSKWAWDSADKAWKDSIKLKAAMMYTKKVIQPLQTLQNMQSLAKDNK